MEINYFIILDEYLGCIGNILLINISHYINISWKNESIGKKSIYTEKFAIKV